jgi:DNA-binding transcriptional MerR regulator
MYSSHNVCEFFEISRETVRSWSREFAPYLSPTANPEQGRQRQFTDADLRVLSLVADFKKQGLLYSDAHAALQAGQRGDLPDTVHAIVPGERNRLAEMEQQVRELRAALSEAIEDRQNFAGQVEALTKQLEQTRRELREAYKEIGRLEARMDDD